jgi:type VI secretion system protein ImpC
MHHPDFQKLEGTWRGLHYLVHQSETGEALKIRVLNIKKQELFKDLEKAVEFDQSGLFKKVYEEEYGQLGGQPYGMLIGDYDFSRQPEDVQLLKMVSNVAAAAHAPFITNVSPKMFNFDRFTELANPRDLAKIFDSVEYASFKSFRESEDSRYVALTMPRVLGRLPYGQNFTRVEAFNFEESVDGMNHDKYLWMGSAWAYGARITAAYAEDGWFARTRGVEGGGKVEGLPVHTFPTDDGDVAMKCPDGDRHHRSPRVRVVQPRLLAAVACQGQGLRRLHGHSVGPEAQDLLRPGRECQRRAVGQAQLPAVRVAFRPLPEGDGARQDRLVHGTLRLRTLAE